MYCMMVVLEVVGRAVGKEDEGVWQKEISSWRTWCHHVITRHLLTDPPPPPPEVMTSFMNSALPLDYTRHQLPKRNYLVNWGWAILTMCRRIVTIGRGCIFHGGAADFMVSSSSPPQNQHQHLTARWNIKRSQSVILRSQRSSFVLFFLHWSQTTLIGSSLTVWIKSRIPSLMYQRNEITTS